MLDENADAVAEAIIETFSRVGRRAMRPRAQGGIPYAPAIAATGELLRRLEDSCPSTFSIEIGNERTRVPVA